jgi:ABC-type lipoprotein export system ATPase subunit
LTEKAGAMTHLPPDRQPALPPRREIVRLDGICRTFHLGGTAVPVLNNIDMVVSSGEFIGIMGPSGSGKSTLLNLLGLLDRPTGGHYYLDGEEVAQLSDAALAARRNARIGFIFQSFNLFPHLTVAQNIEVPMVYAEMHLRARHDRARELADAVGLGHRLKHRPSELSGGECQRIAIARALANRPSFLLADEPTGNLDDHTGSEIMAMLSALHREQGVTLLMVTHNPELQLFFDRTIRMRDGRIVSK